MSVRKAVQCVNGKYQLTTSQIPKPGKGQLLIQNAYSTINPHDRLQYQFKKIEGNILGSEGSGVVVDVGEGVDRSLVGYHVSFWENGWATHCIRDAHMVMHLHKSIDMKVAANSYINPLTACGFLYVAQNTHKSAGAILTAGSSNLSRVFTRYAEANHMKVISIVRSAEAKEMMQTKYNQKYVVVFTEKEQEAALLENYIEEVQPKVLFDALSGPVGGHILEKMQAGAQMISIGNLTSQPITVNSNDLRWNNKHISSFMVNRWLESLPDAVRFDQFKNVERDLLGEKQIFKSTITAEIELEQWEDFLLSSQNQAKDGKYLVKIN